MPAGTYPAGAGRAGLDPLQPLSGLPRATPPMAVAWNGEKRDYVLDAQGRYVEVHWVDAAMFDACRYTLGSVLSAPELGNKVGLLTHLPLPRLQALVEDAVAQATAKLTSRRVAIVDGITLDLSVYARLAYRVDYRNLVLNTRGSVPVK